jgi:hypothetical protein
MKGEVAVLSKPRLQFQVYVQKEKLKLYDLIR